MQLCCLLFFSYSRVSAQSDKDSITATIVAPADSSDQGPVKKYFLPKTMGDSFGVQQRYLPGEPVKKMKADKNFWYADADFKKKGIVEKKQTPFFRQTWFQTLLWLLIIGGFAAGLMWYLSGSNVGLFRKKNVDIARMEENDAIPDDIFSINYQKEIDKAAAQANYRLAVRLMFLRLLKSMADKNIIHYTQDRTNLDYITELHPTRYYPPFFRLTRHYEYSWYGQFEVGEEAYKSIRREFDQLDKEIR